MFLFVSNEEHQEAEYWKHQRDERGPILVVIILANVRIRDEDPEHRPNLDS